MESRTGKTDAVAAQAVSPWLDEGERLFWAGRPRQGLLFRPLDLFSLPLVALWGALVWHGAGDVIARGPDGLSWLADGVTFLITLVLGYFAFLRFLVAAWQRAHTVYAVTDARLMILYGIVRHHLLEVPLALVTESRLDLFRDGSGTISFGDLFPYPAFIGGIAVPTLELMAATQFYRVPDAAAVHRLIRSMCCTTAPARETETNTGSDCA